MRPWRARLSRLAHVAVLWRFCVCSPPRLSIEALWHVNLIMQGSLNSISARKENLICKPESHTAPSVSIIPYIVVCILISSVTQYNILHSTAKGVGNNMQMAIIEPVKAFISGKHLLAFSPFAAKPGLITILTASATREMCCIMLPLAKRCRHCIKHSPQYCLAVSDKKNLAIKLVSGD